jgi:membrane-associated phospholipid phosphatase
MMVSNVASAGNGVVDRSSLDGMLDRWLMFGDHGAVARRHMAVVWCCVGGCALVDVVYLINSRLSFAPSNWTEILQGLAYYALGAIFITIASHRLRSDPTRAAVLLRTALGRTALLLQASLPIAALLIAGVTLSYLITAADLPLRDASLAQIDRALGFDWLGFLQATNASPVLTALLFRAYQTVGPVAEFTIVWLALTGRGERLAEFVAVLALSTIGLCAVMWLVPAAGAFAYYKPEPLLFDHLSAGGELWSFFHAFTALRDGSLGVIDLSALEGVVSFPSFHTILGVIPIYALRDRRALLMAALAVNGTMIVSTMPVGGHHLVDVVAGAAVSLGAILVTRCMARTRRASAARG